ncbi:MAG: hypothetical protein AB1635_02330 [Acidobacteriota bacterium]
MSEPGEARRLGATATAAVGVVLLGWALTVDVPRATPGFFSDGSTYYMLAYSLAEDLDFEYRREDLMRVWREYPAGPEGLFLKRGRDVTGVGLSGRFPFVALESAEDPDAGRLYFGKSFIFPLAAAPFVRAFGTNGFLVLHAVLMTFAFLCAYAFLAARGEPVAAALFAGAFLFLSVAPVYMAWMTPDFFNAAVVLFGYFFWLYKEVAPVRSAWLSGARSDVVAALWLGIATFSKPTHVLLVLPLLATLAARRQWARAVVVGAVFAAVVGGLFGWNIAITGEWNYQGGDRRTFYAGSGGFPFYTEWHTFDRVGVGRATNEVPLKVLTTADAVGDVFRHNLFAFFVGRHTGFALYYFPGFLALVLFLIARGRPLWQWFTCAAAVGSAILLVLYMPYTYSGGGGPVGNRYFLGTYPVFLFLAPPLGSPLAGLVAMGVGGAFTMQLILNPFAASFKPADHTKGAPFRWFPPERSLVNDLPVNTEPARARQPLGGTPPMLGYFLDDNVYDREGTAFWVRGASRADILLRAPSRPETSDGREVLRPVVIKWLEVHLETGLVPNRVTIRTGAETQVVEVPAHDRRAVVVAMPPGLPYKPYPEFPTNYIYDISISAERGFVPMFEYGGRDNRFLGVYVRLVPVYE